MAKVGRPSVITPEILAKLEEAFLVGASDLEACFYADISKTALYDYQNANPSFTERKEKLKESLKLRAKINVSRSLNSGDVNDSKWYLERKAKDEFAQRSIMQHAGTGEDGEMVSKVEVVHVNPTAGNTGENS